MTGRHHIVSKGFQRLFTDGGNRIRWIERASLNSKVIGISDAFVEDGFNTIRTPNGSYDDAEEAWARIESLVLPGARDLAAGVENEHTLRSVKAVAAIHWARSYSLRDAFYRIANEYRPVAVAELERNETLRDAWTKTYGTDPALMRAYIVAHFDEMLAGNRFFMAEVADYYNKVTERFRPLHVQVIRVLPRRIGFLLGDVPAVLADEKLLRIGTHNRLALDDASHLFMPLGRWTGIMLTARDEGNAVASPEVVQRLNHLSWRGSMRYLASHPDENLRRALAR